MTDIYGTRMPVQFTPTRLVHNTPPTRDKTTAQTIARRRMMDEQQQAFIGEGRQAVSRIDNKYRADG
jgi:hypothetical protein